MDDVGFLGDEEEEVTLLESVLRLRAISGGGHEGCLCFSKGHGIPESFRWCA